jgi:hypothetical protein
MQAEGDVVRLPVAQEGPLEFATFFADEHRELFRPLCLVTGNRADAADLMQGRSIVFMTPNLSINHYSAFSVDLTTGRTKLIVPDGSTPELSPDGASIAFNSWVKPRIRLIHANSDGSQRHVIARFDGDDGYEEWSPDSTQIAFVASTDEHGFGTYVYDLDTGETRFVTAGRTESCVDNDHILVS